MSGVKAESADNIAEAKKCSPWYQAAAGSAVVGCVFSLIVAGLLIENHLHIKILDPVRSERLEMMKLQVIEQPDGERLLPEIRRLDLQIRRSRITRQQFSRRGGYLLAGGLVVLFVGLKSAAVFRKRAPAPGPPGDVRARQVREALLARRAVMLGLCVLGAAGLILTIKAGVDFGKAQTAGSSYPGAEEIRKNWHRFRGPGGLGISAHENVPLRFSGKTGEGILWKKPVPLPGNNSPILWEGRVFLSGADEKSRQVYCFDADSGELLWMGEVGAVGGSLGKAVEVMNDTGYAAPTMVTDGRRACAIFATGDIGCFDFDGKKIWQRNLGVPESAYGYASSLEMYRNLVLVQYDQGVAEDEKSRMLALDGFTGQPVWEVKRPVPNSWTSPIVVEIADKPQLITCGEPWVIACEPGGGREIWRAKCVGGDVAPSPIYAGGFVFAIEPYDKLVAIRPDGRGDVTKTHVAWIAEDGIPDICCPLSNGKLIFLLTTEGTLTCYKVSDGGMVWEKDMKAGFKASPSLAGERVYLLSDKGVMVVIEAAAQYKELARSELGEACFASPAFADGRIYIRGAKNLYCIGGGD